MSEKVDGEKFTSTISPSLRNERCGNKTCAKADPALRTGRLRDRFARWLHG